MNKNQMEMLSIKNAIERNVHNLLETYKIVDDHKQFQEEVFRMVNAFYVGRQIDSGFCVTIGPRRLEVRFQVNGDWTGLTFLLPLEFCTTQMPTQPADIWPFPTGQNQFQDQLSVDEEMQEEPKKTEQSIDVAFENSEDKFDRLKKYFA